MTTSARTAALKALSHDDLVAITVALSFRIHEMESFATRWPESPEWPRHLARAASAHKKTIEVLAAE